MKKTLAIILSLALVICMMPAAAFAETTTSETTNAIQDSWVSVDTATSYTYNGQAHTPKVTVTKPAAEGTEGGTATVLIEGTDYTVSYQDNVKAGTGTATVKVSGKGTYSGDVTKKFTINPASMDVLTITIDKQVSGLKTSTVISSDDVHYFYGGNDVTSKIKDNFTVKVKTEDSVAEVTANENTNFTGSKDVNFEVGYNIDTYYEITFSSDNIEYTGKDLSSSVILKQKSNPIKSITASDYTISFSRTPIDVGDVTVTVKGRNNYAGTITKTMQIKQRDVEKAGNYISIAAIPTQVSSKWDIDPVVTDTLTGKTLVKGADYNIATSSINVSGSTGTVPFIFTGNYTGTKNVNFAVVTLDYDVAKTTVYYGSKDVSYGTMSASAYMYNGSSQPLQNIVVYTDYAKKETLSSRYYTLSYEYYDEVNKKNVTTTSPVEAKEYKVYVVGQNGYAGKKEIGTYTIHKYDMKYVTISVSMSSSTSKPSVTVKGTYENIYFKEGKDYEVSSYVMSSTNKVRVTVTPLATGNLTGSASSEYYAITAKSISSCNAYFTNGKSSSAYTGSTISVPITVKDGYYTVLTQGTDYTVTYKNSLGKVVSSIKDAGTYTIEITGKGLYTGTTYLTYTVTGNDISSYTVTLKEYSVMADGYAKLPVIVSVARGSAKLSSSDYTVTYQDSTGKTVTSIKTPGTYKVVVTGTGRYSGSTYATFRVVGLSQYITGVESSYKVYSGDTMMLYPKATEGTFTYTSSDSSIASVSAYGVVTAHKAGRAKITITTTGNTKYDQVSTSTVIKVYPKKAVITKKPWTNGKKAQLKVRWNKQDNVTRYEIRYSRDKKFSKSSYLTKKVTAANNDYTTQSTTIKNLKSGYTYYVKVRAVKEVYNDNGKKLTYYGAWSGWRSVKVK